jgi:hypothetical protein
MIGTAFEVYKEVNPANKTAKWADYCLTILRRDWRPLVNPLRAQTNKKLLLSQQPMDKIMASFKDKEFLRTTEFNPLGIMENLKNTLVEEITKTPPRAELRAVDPSAINEREADIELLKNRRIIQGDLSKYQGQIGMPPYKVDYGQFKGNADKFDKMGLDDQDPDDINFYERNFQRLHYEIAGQSVVNNIMKLNRFDEERIEDYVIDAMSYKTICMQSYVDQITGEIKQRYVYPEIAYGLFGDANDGHDDICRGWQDNTTVMEFLQMVGNEFDWDRDWWQLLWAINFSNGYKYTGFRRNNVLYDSYANGGMIAARIGLDPATGPNFEGNILDWSMAYNYKIYTGYCEWNTVEATETYLRKKNNPDFVEIVPFGYDLKKKKQVREYYTESYYQQQWYRCYFIATTSISQWIYGFGKVYMQALEGANDEYASGTLCYYRKKGQSAVEIAKPYIDLANFTFYRLLWVIHHSKPQEEEFVLEELIQLSKGMQRQFNQLAGTNTVPSFDNILTQMIQYQRENFLRLRSFPQVEGRTIAQLPPLEGKRNGVDPIAITMQAVVTWAEMQIATKIGMNPIRTGAQPQPRQSFKSEINAIQNSFNATGYVYRMIQFLKERVATTTLNFASDIIKFKDAIPYKWLQTLVGEEVLNGLSLLEKFAAHRYGIYIRDYNSEIDRQEVKQAATIALQKGTLTQDQWFVITQTEDYQKANQILAFLERKKAKLVRKQQLQDMQIKDQMEQKAYERQKDLIVTKGKLDIQKAQIEAEGFKAAAQIQGDSRIAVKQISIDNEPDKQAAKSDSQKELATTKENLSQQQPFAERGAA